MQKKRHRQSVGTLISTLSFAGVSLALADQAMQAEGMRMLGLWLTSAVCMAAALRYQIASAIEKFQGDE